MASKTGSGLLVVVVVVVAGAVFAPKLFGMVGSLISDVTGANDPVIVGEGDAALMVAADARPKVAACSTSQIIQDKRCGDLKIVIMDAAKMSYITRNISLAWSEGRRFILHKDSAGRDGRYNAVCKQVFVKKYNNGSCDEYPFASTDEGGSGARTEEVHLDEQNCQGGTLSTSYRYQGIKDGDQFLVVISHPGKIASKPWQGEDVRVGQC